MPILVLLSQNAQSDEKVILSRCTIRTSTLIKNATVVMVNIQQMHAVSRMLNASIVTRSGTKACLNKGNSKTEFRSSYQQKRGGRTHHISHNDDEALYAVSDVTSVNVVGNDEVKVDVDTNATLISFTVDTASSVYIISKETYTNHFKSMQLTDSKAKLRGYTGHYIDLVGEITVIAKYNGQEFQLPLLVPEVKRTSLFGRNWMERIILNWEEILHIERRGGNSLERLLKQYTPVLADGYGEMTSFKAHIILKDDVAPIFHKARPVP